MKEGEDEGNDKNDQYVIRTKHTWLCALIIFTISSHPLNLYFYYLSPSKTAQGTPMAAANAGALLFRVETRPLAKSDI